MSNVVIISAVHDYRMARRGSVQAIADAFVRQGFETSFVSIRFSALSKVKNDPRWFLADEANKVSRHNGVDCFLWRTSLHPFRTRMSWLNACAGVAHDLYARIPNARLDELLAHASIVIVESGLGIVMVPRIRRLNPNALVIYRASDCLDTIGAHPLLQQRLEQTASLIDHYCLLAEAMAPQFAFARSKTFVVPQGIQIEDFENVGANPYGRARNGVCVGSMLFDASYVEIAAARLPHVDFHLIGVGACVSTRANVIVYDEMPFAQTLPYIVHADFGFAPYRLAPAAGYLSESSLKLTQFAYLRKAAVCPHFVVGGRAHRFGYTPGCADEIEQATQAAMQFQFDSDAPGPLSWDELVPRFLRPQDFADTVIAPERFG